ncbi:uncharacterized protein BDZ99DRAFT_525491 [Mytilinidion resinicola]|uniref:Uncharacterized protein n=1 Tax=Mytilinidion resinicola TaxID=574789 RepID=A0A6A6Y7J3_9PEZI|nr:uncharacterized protein BDZ99DRAFT_525491 [Mytilinidion resinicola]KAF2804660.1 hypothetical protein BDZ99DRAFT_525491 [Mytilinidion resinicola]
MPATTRSVAKKDASASQLQQTRQVESEEQHASASAQAGLNLNLLGAVSGIFSAKSKKTTNNNPDGSSVSTEERAERGQASRRAAGNATAIGAANANSGRRKMKEVQAVDHLGIEG